MTAALPTGVVTFLFTDVEGSTKLLHELGGRYAGALQEHRRVLRAAFQTHHGVEVDTQGDAFFVAFGRASDAVAAAVDAQRALAAGQIRVRMGLHTGEPQLTDEGYVGLDVHKGARIAAVGHGGQVLMSQATRALVEVDARDLGPHRLKDLTAPERIYQLSIDGLPSDFPRLQTLEAGMRNLPAARTSFVGREEELGEIDRMLEEPDCRLVTLVGPGGVGKSRLALEAAARRIEHYPHGVHYVPLAGVPAPDLLAPAVAESLQFQVDSAHSAIPARDQLIDYLRERSALLVLDNFEHLLDARDVVTQIIEEAPLVEMLTTSRERLQVQSEWVLDVGGLELTSDNGHASSNGHHDSAASRLFVDRARQVDAGFVLVDEERPQVERVCRLVHGMPLGIELAAAWVSMLSVAEIADEIEHNLGFLQTSMRDVPERHRSLRAAFDQSWRLLAEDARHIFAQLSVFRGGFTREAAAAVAEANIGQLHDLVAKSLVRRTEMGRFELHELLRQYAAERLAETPDEMAATSERHARHYLGRLAERRPTLDGPNMADARDELRPDLDNLRLAAEGAIGNWPEQETRSLLSALHLFFFVHGPFEGAETFDRLAGAAGVEGNLSADPALVSDVALAVLVHRAGLQTELGYDEEVERLLLACLPVLRERDLRDELGHAVHALGIMGTYKDTYPEAARYLDEAIVVLTAAGERFWVSAALAWLGFVRLLENDLDRAGKAFRQMHNLALESGGPLMLAYALSKLGILADAEGRYADAMRLHMEANTLFEGVGDVGGTGYTLSRASLSAYGLGDYPEAMRLGRAGFEAFRAVNHRWGMIGGLCRMGFAALSLGRPTEAREHLIEALGRARASKAISLELLALSGIGALLAEDGDRNRAAVLLTFALGHEQLPAAYGFAARPALGALEASLSPEELAQVREAAAAASLDELVSGALG
jgi:predicted ATPase/class 3 adenylate cyclase/tetratricopeptide (TPR) repeat protein